MRPSTTLIGLLAATLTTLTLSAPIPAGDTTCVASTLNIGTCDTDSGNLSLDLPVTLSPDINLVRRDAAPEPLAAPEPAPEPEPLAAPQDTTCVASTLNVGTCDDNSGNVNVDAPVTVDPTVGL